MLKTLARFWPRARRKISCHLLASPSGTILSAFSENFPLPDFHFGSILVLRNSVCGSLNSDLAAVSFRPTTAAEGIETAGI
ncbi:MAG: hypothetical protein NT123_24030 [Proteobacteria bacterium]|nr:hypothetical protein [Pseudomonadota bacterium]